MLVRSAFITLASASLVAAASNLTWANTKNLFVFGDSYTAEGYNISAGINSPTPGWTSSNGPNWVSYLRNTYNVTSTKVYNLAYGGATIDSNLVTPYLPTVQSIVTQVSLFQRYLAPKPAAAKWTSDDSLFAFWIGINDVGNSFYWSNVTQSDFHATLMTRLFGQVETLYQSGARNFLFLTVPPTDRSPLIISGGDWGITTIKASLADYNAQLKSAATAFQQKHAKDIGRVTVFDTQPIFNVYLDQAATFGFVNATGYCDAYANGTPAPTTQVAGCAPVSSYFWLNSLHPLFTVHNALAKAISTKLSGY